MKLCPVCETQNPDGAKNCETCGESLAIPQRAAPAPAAAAPAPASPAPVAAAAPSTPRWCPIEGLEFAPGTPEHQDGYCSCGAELVADRSQVAPDAEPLPAEERGLPETPAAQPPSPVAPPRPASAAAAAEAPPLPRPGTWCLVVYQNRKPVHYHAIVHDETLIGRYDPVSGAYPQLDLTPFDPEASTSRKHAFVYRQEGKFTLKPVTNAGTQLANELVEMGDRRDLSDGDVIVLGGRVALKFLQVK